MVRISSPTYVVRQNFATRKLNDASARLKNIRLNFIYERGGGGCSEETAIFISFHRDVRQEVDRKKHSYYSLGVTFVQGRRH